MIFLIWLCFLHFNLFKELNIVKDMIDFNSCHSENSKTKTVKCPQGIWENLLHLRLSSWYSSKVVLFPQKYLRIHFSLVVHLEGYKSYLIFFLSCLHSSFYYSLEELPPGSHIDISKSKDLWVARLRSMNQTKFSGYENIFVMFQ